jgi:UDP-N-acetylglucosamine 2-epimerase (non-hydrolysing)
MNRILICFGTRPEYIKVKSLIENLPNNKTCFTGQHPDLLKNINVNYKLDMSDGISTNRLNNIYCNIFKYTNIFDDIDYVLVQGDTSTASAIALSAFHNNKKIIHLEAGLRSGNLKDPYPEEMNRQVISRIADIHLCPTEYNRENLNKEGIFDNIFVVGNTGLDNISKENNNYGNKVLITLHRRDNLRMMDKWFTTIDKIAERYNDLEFILPIHPNPEIRKHRYLLKNIKVIEPMTHSEMIDILKECRFVISDSGGLQEECSFLNKKIIVCRRTTERPETIGTHSTMCPYPEILEKIVDNIYEDYEINAQCPYGDGMSWKKIVDVLNTNIYLKI